MTLLSVSESFEINNHESMCLFHRLLHIQRNIVIKASINAKKTLLTLQMLATLTAQFQAAQNVYSDEKINQLESLCV